MSEKHCPTCICGRRAPVQRDTGKHGRPARSAGTIAWEEHLEAYAEYAGRFGNSQSAERIAQRGGFGYGELIEFLGHEPTTWDTRW